MRIVGYHKRQISPYRDKPLADVDDKEETSMNKEADADRLLFEARYKKTMSVLSWLLRIKYNNMIILFILKDGPFLRHPFIACPGVTANFALCLGNNKHMQAI